MSQTPPSGQSWGPSGSPPPGQGWGPPTQPGWGAPQPPPTGPKPKPPIYRRPWFIIVGMLGLLVTVGAILGDPAPVEDINQAATTAPRVTQAPDAEPATTARPTSTQRQTDLNKPVRDGSFEFVVTAFRCRADECRATMTVENIGNDPGTMFADNQYLFDTQGRKFEADSSLTDSLLFEELNPGRMVRGTIRWKVSEGFKADYLELHDSAFSGGVEVKVS